MERAEETHLPSASSLSGGFAPDEDMMVKAKGVLSMVCGSKQVISHAIVNTLLISYPEHLSLLRVSLPSPSSFVTDGSVKKPGRIKSRVP